LLPLPSPPPLPQTHPPLVTSSDLPSLLPSQLCPRVLYGSPDPPKPKSPREPSPPLKPHLFLLLLFCCSLFLLSILAIVHFVMWASRFSDFVFILIAVAFFFLVSGPSYRLVLFLLPLWFAGRGWVRYPPFSGNTTLPGHLKPPPPCLFFRPISSFVPVCELRAPSTAPAVPVWAEAPLMAFLDLLRFFSSAFFDPSRLMGSVRSLDLYFRIFRQPRDARGHGCGPTVLFFSFLLLDPFCCPCVALLRLFCAVRGAHSLCSMHIWCLAASPTRLSSVFVFLGFFRVFRFLRPCSAWRLFGQVAEEHLVKFTYAVLTVRSSPSFPVL